MLRAMANSAGSGGGESEAWGVIPHMLRMPEHEKIITERLDDTATHTNHCKKKKGKKRTGALIRSGWPLG